MNHEFSIKTQHFEGQRPSKSSEILGESFFTGLQQTTKNKVMITKRVAKKNNTTKQNEIIVQYEGKLNKLHQEFPVNSSISMNALMKRFSANSKNILIG
jgi:hypothetical protein